MLTKFNLFKPANVQNRAIFENATGVKLPDTNSLTRSFLKNYISNTENNGGLLDNYTEKEINNWKSSNKIIVYENDQQFSQFVKKSLDNVDTQKKMYFGKIPGKVAKYVYDKTGIDISGLNVALKGYEIRKILLNSHGNMTKESLRGQEPITETDLLNIPDIITNADDVILSDKLYEGKPAIRFVKNIDGENYVLTYVSKKHHDLAIQTMYKTKNKSLATAENANANSSTSETTNGTALYNNNIPQTDNTVNNKYMQNVVENVPSYEDFRETILEKYPNMPEDAIQEAYNGYYGLTDEGSNDIINNNDVYYQRREDNGPQGRYNGNSNEQSGSDFESTDTIRTESYKFRNGRDYKVRRTGLWQKAYGRVSGTLKKATPKYIRHGNRAIMFSEYDNARSVKQFFKDVYNRDVIICKDDIIERDFGSKEMPEFNASAAYVQGSILISLGRDSETSFVHEMIHEGQNDVEYENAVDSIKKLMDINALDNHILEKESDYGNTYENRVNFDDDILYETYADIISRLATKEWREYGSRSELFADKESYNRAKEIAEDYVAYLINNPPQKNIDTIIKDFSEFENDFADDYMFEKSESNPYFALKESEADDALAYMEQNYGEMYRNLIKKYGAIEKGMQPRIDAEVAKQSGKGQYVSKYARTMAETDGIANAMDGEFEKMVVEGRMSHERVTDKKAYSKAEQSIERDGFEDSVKEFEFSVKTGKLNKNDIVKGQILLNVACQDKDVELAKRLAVNLSVAATQFGQNVQAFSMLKKMSPDGQLYYLERFVFVFYNPLFIFCIKSQTFSKKEKALYFKAFF